MHTIPIDSKGTKIIAHRGAAKVWVENSLPAFCNSAKLSYWGIETDVHCTKDEKLIITHDDDTTRVTGKSFIVEETDFETLRREARLLGLDGNDAIMPTLKEYVTACKNGSKVCVLELKNRMSEEAIKAIIEELKALDYLDNVVFISFSHTNMRTIHKLLPTQPIQFLMSAKGFEKGMELVREMPMDIDVQYTVVTKELVDEIHALGHKINCWTVNDASVANELISLGVDFITTDILE